MKVSEVFNKVLFIGALLASIVIVVYVGTNIYKYNKPEPKYQKEYSVTHYDGNNNITGVYYMKCTPKQMVEWCEKTPHILSNGSVDNIIIFKTGRIEVNLINNE